MKIQHFIGYPSLNYFLKNIINFYNFTTMLIIVNSLQFKFQTELSGIPDLIRLIFFKALVKTKLT